MGIEIWCTHVTPWEGEIAKVRLSKHTTCDEALQVGASEERFKQMLILKRWEEELERKTDVNFTRFQQALNLIGLPRSG